MIFGHPSQNLQLHEFSIATIQLRSWQIITIFDPFPLPLAVFFTTICRHIWPIFDTSPPWLQNIQNINVLFTSEQSGTLALQGFTFVLLLGFSRILSEFFRLVSIVFLMGVWYFLNLIILYNSMCPPCRHFAERQVFDLDVVYMYQKKMRSPLSDVLDLSTVAAVLKSAL